MKKRKLCDLCQRYPVKVDFVAYGCSLVDVCGCCHRKIANLKPRRRRRELLMQQLFQFVDDDTK